MRVLFDHNVPKRLRTLLPGHEVSTSREMRWDALKNGDLLKAAEEHGFDAMVTGDKNLSYQQNLEGRKLALVILADTDWPTLKQDPAPVLAALNGATPGSSRGLTNLFRRAAPQNRPACARDHGSSRPALGPASCRPRRGLVFNSIGRL